MRVHITRGIADKELEALARAVALSPFIEEHSSVQSELIDWGRFLALVDRHRVGAMALAGAARIAMPDDVAAKLAGDEARNATNYLRSISILRCLSGQFARAGISWVLLKGVAVAEAAYARPALREMIDIDLMVDAGRIDDAEKIIFGESFTRIHPRFTLDDAKRANFERVHSAFSYFRRTDGTQLDLHWRTSQNVYLVPQIDARWREMLGEDTTSGFPTLRPDIHLAYVLAHGAKHGWVRLKWLADVERMVTTLDDKAATELVATLHDLGLQALAGSAFALCRTLFGSRFSDDLAEMAFCPKARKLHDHALQLIVAAMPVDGAKISDPVYLWTRIRHSLGLVSNRKYRRTALMLEMVRSHDFEDVSLPKGWVRVMAVISPLRAIGRAIMGTR